MKTPYLLLPLLAIPLPCVNCYCAATKEDTETAKGRTEVITLLKAAEAKE